MRFCRLFLIVMLCTVVCIGLFSVSAFAATIEQYSYNGVVLPKFEATTAYYFIATDSNGDYYAHCKDSASAFKLSDPGYNDCCGYKLIDGEWVEKVWYYVDVFPFFASASLKNSDGSVFLSASEPVVTLVEVPDPPPTMDDILGDIVDIFNSCISWVGSVGSTILDKPILLFYAVLPLCGIGVGFFKRLKS